MHSRAQLDARKATDGAGPGLPTDSEKEHGRKADTDRWVSPDIIVLARAQQRNRRAVY